MSIQTQKLLLKLLLDRRKHLNPKRQPCSRLVLQHQSQVRNTLSGKRQLVNMKMNAHPHFLLTKRERELSSQVTWYIYGNQRISKRTFEYPYFRKMMTVSGTQNLMTRANLLKWVRAEYEIFLLYLRFLIKKALEFAYGNPFAHFIHDGGTLANKEKYQTGGLQFI